MDDDTELNRSHEQGGNVDSLNGLDADPSDIIGENEESGGEEALEPTPVVETGRADDEESTFDKELTIDEERYPLLHGPGLEIAVKNLYMQKARESGGVSAMDANKLWELRQLLRDPVACQEEIKSRLSSARDTVREAEQEALRAQDELDDAIVRGDQQEIPECQSRVNKHLSQLLDARKYLEAREQYYQGSEWLKENIRSLEQEILRGFEHVVPQRVLNLIGTYKGLESLPAEKALEIVHNFIAAKQGAESWGEAGYLANKLSDRIERASPETGVSVQEALGILGGDEALSICQKVGMIEAYQTARGNAFNEVDEWDEIPRDRYNEINKVVQEAIKMARERADAATERWRDALAQMDGYSNQQNGSN